MTTEIIKPKVHVLVAALFDPAVCRVSFDIDHGLSVAQIIAKALPRLREEELRLLRVTLVKASGMVVVERPDWETVIPDTDVNVVLRVVPADDGARSFLSILVSVAAIALGAHYGPMLGTAIGIGKNVAGALIGLVTNVVGALLVNSLYPPGEPDKVENRYSITGWRNQLNPDGPVPVPLGTMRFAPPFAASSYTEIIGGLQHVVALFVFGIGELEISDIKIGDTPLSKYDEVETELRLGLPDDETITLYPRQVVEETLGPELTRRKPRDDLGEVIDNEEPEEKPVVRTTGRDASAAGVVLAFPAGLYRMGDDQEPQIRTVEVKIEYAEVGSDVWTEWRTMAISAKAQEPFYRIERFPLPWRGRWDVRMTRMTKESIDPQKQDRTIWAALQTLRPEYPLNSDLPLALLAVRVKATYQLNSQLDSINALVSRICLDWDHVSETWIKRATSNPASLYRYTLQSEGNPRPVPDSGIDLDQLADWHDFCRIKDLKYDAVLGASETTLRDVLREIAVAGRAAPRQDGVKWGVVIDRPQELVVDHINPRNSWGFSAERTYVRTPDAFRVKFPNAANSYEPDERLVPWPDHTGDIELTELLELPGKTDPVEIYREALRRAYEVEYRPDTYRVTQAGGTRVATRGDLVMVSYDTLDRIQQVARVSAIEGRVIELDEPVTMAEGQSYGVRFRVFADTAPGGAPDTIGTSVVREVDAMPGDQSLLLLKGDGDLPALDALVHFGPLNADSAAMRVLSVETGEDMTSILRLVDASPIIDDLTDAAVIPPWTGRFGDILAPNLTAPPVPSFSAVRSGYAVNALQPTVVYFLVEPESGPVIAASFEVEHRRVFTEAWTLVTVPAGDGGGSFEVYEYGAPIEMRMRALSDAGIASDWSDVVTVSIGGADEVAPTAVDIASVEAVGGLGNATLTIAVASQAVVQTVQVYRVPTGETPDTDQHAIGSKIAVSAGGTFIFRDGDTTPKTLIANGGFQTSADWTTGTGWAIGAGKATHTGPTQGTLYQSVGLVAGEVYRIALELSGVTAGTLTPRFVGGFTQTATALAEDGKQFFSITAVSGNSILSFLASGAFDGSIDDVTLYRETAASAPAGTWDYYVGPFVLNAPTGPLSGPFTTTIV